jgi:hypothetical protein
MAVDLPDGMGCPATRYVQSLNDASLNQSLNDSPILGQPSDGLSFTPQQRVESSQARASSTIGSTRNGWFGQFAPRPTPTPVQVVDSNPLEESVRPVPVPVNTDLSGAIFDTATVPLVPEILASPAVIATGPEAAPDVPIAAPLPSRSTASISTSVVSAASTVQPSSTSATTTPNADLTTGSSLSSASATSTSPTLLSSPKADFDRNGTSDIVSVNVSTKAVAIWLLSGTTYSSSVALPTNTTGWTPSGYGDYNDDGQWDILARNYTTGANAIWLMNGTRLSSTVSLPTLSPASPNDWILSDGGDFNGDGQWDILWRNPNTGENRAWLMNGTTSVGTTTLPSLAGTNLRVVGTADFNQDQQTDILWHNHLTGENTVWLLKLNSGTSGTPANSANTTPTISVLGTQSLPTATTANWQITAVGDFNWAAETAQTQPHRPDLVWYNSNTDNTRIWLMTANSYQAATVSTLPPTDWSTGYAYTASTAASATLSDLVFSGEEGDTGTFQIRLAQAPTSAVSLRFTTGNFLVLDADANPANGTQDTITFTPQNWNQARTVGLIAEKDGSSSDRSSGNTIAYTVSTVATSTTTATVLSTGTYNLGTITNTYAPDTTRFNIELDFRNDASGYWTASRRAIAQQAADDWAAVIANEWAGLQLNSSINLIDNGFYSTSAFTTKRYVDDLVVFVNGLNSGGLAGGYGGVEYNHGGWLTSPEAMPRVSQIAIDHSLTDAYLYNAVLHELGHALGLLGLNWDGYVQQDISTPQTAVFQGAYSTAANGGRAIPLMSQDGANPVTGEYDYWHPAASVRSVMSYGWLYRLSGPTAIDLAMLADSGYQVRGVNAPNASAPAA